MSSSPFKIITDHFETTIVANTDVEKVFSGLQGGGNKKIYAEYGVRSISPLRVDANSVIDSKYSIIFVVIADDYELINTAIYAIMILWYNDTIRLAFKAAGGLKIKPINIHPALESNLPSKNLGAVEFEFELRQTYVIP